MPDFKLADLVHDYRTLEVARQDAAKLIYDEAFWTGDDYRHLREMLEETGVLNGERID